MPIEKTLKDAGVGAGSALGGGLLLGPVLGPVAGGFAADKLLDGNKMYTKIGLAVSGVALLGGLGGGAGGTDRVM